MLVDTGQVRGAAYGIRPLGEAILNVRVDVLAANLAESLQGGAVDADCPDIARRWRARLGEISADVGSLAHELESSAALYEAVEARLAALARTLGGGSAVEQRLADWVASAGRLLGLAS